MGMEPLNGDPQSEERIMETKITKRKKIRCATPDCEGHAFAAVAVCRECFASAEPDTRGTPLPPNVDIRTFDDMPLNVRAVRDSDTMAEASDEGFKAAFQLWCAAWHQIPAASIPDDDGKMARLAGYGRDLRRWKKIREEALRGFVRCEDGRWYHLYMCDKAWEAWLKSDAGRTSAGYRWGKHQATENKRNTRMGSQTGGISNRNATGNADAGADADANAVQPQLGSQCSEQNRVDSRSSTATSSVPSTARAQASGDGVEPDGSTIQRVADEIWQLAGRTHEADRKRASGNIDDFRHVRGWLKAGHSEKAITDAARTIITGAGEIHSLWGLLAKAMPERLAAQNDAPKAPSEAGGVWRTYARTYFAKAVFGPNEQITGWEVLAPEKRKWRNGGAPPTDPGFQGPLEIFDEVARDLGVADWLLQRSEDRDAARMSA